MNCSGDLHPLTGERTVCSSELPDDLHAAAAWVAVNVLVVRWAHARSAFWSATG